MMDLPGYRARALTLADAPLAFAVIAAQDRHDVGEEVTELADIESEWRRPSFDVARSTRGVFAAADGSSSEDLVACAEVDAKGRCFAAVLPGHRGRGIGTALARWQQAVARERGLDVVGGPVPAGSDGDRLLARLGYDVRWTSWLLALPPGTRVPDRPLPAGCRLRTARVEEREQVHALVEEAFGEWESRAPSSFEDWWATSVGRPGFAADDLRVVADDRDEPVGCCLVQLAGDTAFVAQLAVHRDHRRRGLAQALLADAFRRGRERGATRCELSTDSRTGALGLYEKVGMVVTGVWVNRARRLAGAGLGSPP